jgi:hypothetical protein
MYIMKHFVAYIFIVGFVCSQSSHFVQELADLDKQISELLADPSLKGIEDSIHFMNLYCVEMSGLSMKLENDLADRIMKDLIKLYKKGRPKFIDITLDEYEIKKHLLAKDELLTRFKVVQSDSRSAWDEFVTCLIKKSPDPI